MIRLLAIGDLHWTAHNPVARTDNLKAALTAKLLECWELARRYRVDAIVQTGDVFHTPGITYSTLADLIHVLGRAPAPIYTVAGNHDLFAASPESLYRTPLGFLFQTHALHNAEKGHTWFDPNGSGAPIVRLSGRGYDASTDVDPMTYASPYEDDVTSVHVSHGMVVDRPVPGRHTLISDLAQLGDRAPDMLINGHYHLNLGIHRVGRTLVVASGALCRLTAAVEEIERPVQVALITISDQGTVSGAELITLQSARPGDEVLSREHLIAAAEREHRRDKFLELLAGEETQAALDVAGMVRSIADRDHLPAAVRNEALRRLAKAQEGLAA